MLQDKWAAVTRQWCRLVNMNNNRITKYIFMYNELKGSPRCTNWNFRVKQFYQSIGLHYLCNTNGTYDIPSCVNNIKNVMCQSNEQTWLNKINDSIGRNGGNKLRTYCTFKNSFSPEAYATSIMSKSTDQQWLNFGVVLPPIKLEAGIYNGTPVNNRICEMCDE